MRVFLTGANGWIGSAIVRELVAAGHQVTGLVRSRDKGQSLADHGGTSVVGSLGDLDVLRAAAREADGIVHTAFGLDLSKIVELADEERKALEAMGDVLAGSDRPIVTTSGFLLLPPGEMFQEEARPPTSPVLPRLSEQTTFGLAAGGINASVVRLPRSVHGVGERHGFVPMLAGVARKTGVSAYVGDGQNLWPSVHRLDAARLFSLALERGARGEAYHAVADEGVPFRQIAEALGRQLGVPVVPMAREEADRHFGGLAMWVAGNGPASSARTRHLLGWEPKEVGLLADIDRPDYYR